MPALFTLPQAVPLSTAGALLPAAKLYFFATGTATPQNTYQDIALTTPHANPVIADSAGVFAPIYLDASLPDYRVRLSTSADVQIWQLDDIPASQDESQIYRLIATAPELILEETDATANNGKWRIRVNGEQLTIATLNDAESTAANIMTVDRTGTTVDTVAFPNGALTITGALTASSTLAVTTSATIAGATVATLESGSYTGTLTGLTTSPTTEVSYKRAGGLVVLSWGQQSGTSNTNALSVTGMPAAIKPAAARQGIYVSVFDNAVIEQGRVTVNTSGDLTFSRGADSTVFTTSGSKGVREATIAYLL